MKFFIKKIGLESESKQQYQGVMKFRLYLAEGDKFDIGDVEAILNRELNKKPADKKTAASVVEYLALQNSPFYDKEEFDHELEKAISNMAASRGVSPSAIKNDLMSALGMLDAKEKADKLKKMEEALMYAGESVSRATVKIKAQPSSKKHHTCLDAGEVWLEALKTSIDASMDGELDVAIEEADKTLDEFKKRFEV
jgi:hypothetical protein